MRGKEGNAWCGKWEAVSDFGEQREAGDQDRWETGKRRCRGGNHENRPLSWEDGPEADKEVAYTDRHGLRCGGTFVEPQEWRFGNAWSPREDSGDTAEWERD